VAGGVRELSLRDKQTNLKKKEETLERKRVDLDFKELSLKDKETRLGKKELLLNQMTDEIAKSGKSIRPAQTEEAVKPQKKPDWQHACHSVDSRPTWTCKCVTKPQPGAQLRMLAENGAGLWYYEGTYDGKTMPSFALRKLDCMVHDSKTPGGRSLKWATKSDIMTVKDAIRAHGNNWDRNNE